MTGSRILRLGEVISIFARRVLNHRKFAQPHFFKSRVFFNRALAVLVPGSTKVPMLAHFLKGQITNKGFAILDQLTAQACSWSK